LDKARSTRGRDIEPQLVGASLAERYPGFKIPYFAVDDADVQTTPAIRVEKVSYRVAAGDGKQVLPRCAEDARSGLHPVLLVRMKYRERAQWRAENEGIADSISILGIEHFLAQNIVALSTDRHQDNFMTLQSIIEEYNRRLEAVEADMSLKIEVH
jgi:hypothetical protein